MSWISYPNDFALHNWPLHAGITLDLLRGNLSHVAEQNASDICIGPDAFTPRVGAKGTYTTTGDGWALPYYGPALMTLPRAGSLDTRKVRILVRAYMSAAGGAKADLRFYLRATRDTAGYEYGFRGETGYGTATVEGTSLTEYSDEIDYPEDARPPSVSAYPSDGRGGGYPPWRETYLVILAKPDTAATSVYLESVRLEVDP